PDVSDPPRRSRIDARALGRSRSSNDVRREPEGARRRKGRRRPARGGQCGGVQAGDRGRSVDMKSLLLLVPIVLATAVALAMPADRAYASGRPSAAELESEL